MNTDFNEAIKSVIKMSAAGGLSGVYDNNILSLNFKADDTLELDVNEDTYRLSYITEIHASPMEIRFKQPDIKEVKKYKVGQFKPCPCCEVIIFTFKDKSALYFFDDL